MVLFVQFFKKWANSKGNLDQYSAETLIFRTLQAIYFKSVISQINNGTQITDKRLQGYQPFLDEYGVLRLSGRLEMASKLPSTMKNPIVLPQNHHITTLILRHLHEVELSHVDTGASLAAEFRQKYWSPNLTNAAKIIKKKCVRCRLINHKAASQIMATLPDERLVNEETSNFRPFTYIGMDFAGPFEVQAEGKLTITAASKQKKKANLKKINTVKVYALIVTCSQIRALNVEISDNMTTQSFLLAFERHIAKYGLPKIITTDCGKNFHGAFNELAKIRKNDGIVWKWNPPGASHTGGFFRNHGKNVQASSKENVVQKNSYDGRINNNNGKSCGLDKQSTP